MTNKSKNLVDAIHQIRAEVHNVVNCVLLEAQRLEDVGLSKVAKRLALSVQYLPEMVKRLTESHAEMIDEQIRHSEKTVGETLLLAMHNATNASKVDSGVKAVIKKDAE